jgi:hypothetical protein
MWSRVHVDPAWVPPFRHPLHDLNLSQALITPQHGRRENRFTVPGACPFEHLEARIFESTVEQAKRSSVVQLTAPLLPGSVKVCRRLYISSTALMREDDIN